MGGFEHQSLCFSLLGGFKPFGFERRLVGNERWCFPLGGWCFEGLFSGALWGLIKVPFGPPELSPFLVGKMMFADFLPMMMPLFFFFGGGRGWLQGKPEGQPHHFVNVPNFDATRTDPFVDQTPMGIHQLHRKLSG